MYRIITAILVALSLPVAAGAKTDSTEPREAPTATVCFTKAPGSVLEFISDNTRLDMIDYFQAGSDKHSTNSVGGDCYITDMTDESVSLVASDGLSFQIFVLNRDSANPLIGIIETVETPIPESRLRIYDHKWLRLPSIQFAAPTLKDWLTTDGRKHLDEVADAIPFILAEYSYDPTTATLTVENRMDSYFAPEDKPAATAYISPALKYRWDGKKFKRSDK